MTIFKRMTTSIWASVDRIVTQMENHEALVDASIAEIQRSAAKAKVSLNRVQTDGEKMRARIEENEKARGAWEQRAVRCAKEDEAKALECLKKRNALTRQIETLRVQETEHRNVETQLAADLEAIEKNLRELRVKRNVLKTRESRADALSVLHGDDSRLVGEIGNILDRWEARVQTSEYEGFCSETARDPLEHAFDTEEEAVSLRADLQNLISNQ